MQLYRRYRQWEDGYLAMLDAVNAGRAVDPAWASGASRARLVARFARMSQVERLQLRDVIWRCRGWRGWAWIASIVGVNCIVGALMNLGSPDKFGLLEDCIAVNAAVTLLGYAFARVWFNVNYYGPSKLRLFLWTIFGGLLGVCGAFVGAVAVSDRPLGEQVGDIGPTLVKVGVPIFLGFVGLFAPVLLMRNRELRAENARLAAEAEGARLGRELEASRLRLLQAQIEPHFLFNTLGAVQQLAEHGAPRAAALTAHLIGFLRGSMNGFRNDRPTLEAEFVLVESYLEVMKFRLGERLAYRLDLPAALKPLRTTPTLLITLVENAIKHGIEPAPAGGSIVVAARSDGEELELEVADTGAGMPALPGAGDGLRSIREQLALAHGDAATLELFENEPSGLLARLRMPIRKLG